MIEGEIQARRPFVLEGSALRPEFIAPLVSDTVIGICLHADADFLRERIRAEAGYRRAGEAERGLIDSFVERSLRDNPKIHRAAEENGLRIIDVAKTDSLTDLAEELARRLSSAPLGAEGR